MQRRGLSEVINILRYNSPSKTQIKKIYGMPKYVKDKRASAKEFDLKDIQYKTKDEAPFAVSRTSPGNNLPVYTDVRHNDSNRTIVIRRIEGDYNAMASELQRLFPSYKVEIHQGSIHVNGDLREEVKTWLTHLGF